MCCARTCQTEQTPRVAHKRTPTHQRAAIAAQLAYWQRGAATAYRPPHTSASLSRYLHDPKTNCNAYRRCVRVRQQRGASENKKTTAGLHNPACIHPT